MSYARQNQIKNVRQNTFDAVVVGGGINGASVYAELCKRGYKALLVEKGDFACGTSQSSAMMIWGGSLYLRNLDFSAVYFYSKARDSMIDTMPDSIMPIKIRYIPAVTTRWFGRLYIYIGLYFYWLIGLCRRERPKFVKEFPESDLIQGNLKKTSITYGEGMLRSSDNRFVLDWITPYANDKNIALNYCALLSGEYDGALWRLDLKNDLNGGNFRVSSKWVINCAGIWIDELNHKFNIKSPYKHVFSKGVFINFKRPAQHKDTLIFEVGKHGDAIAFEPWGPISMFGPTETIVKSIKEGFTITDEDIDFLLHHANRNLKHQYKRNEIISLRCGVRPLAVEANFDKDCYPLSLSREFKITKDNALPWISVYGGKLTGCVTMANRVAKMVSFAKPPISAEVITKSNPELTTFPGIDIKVPTANWCMKNEYCYTLNDYLRRRTNISQWVAREGLGSENENLPHLLEIALVFCDNNKLMADQMLANYIKQVESGFDSLINNRFNSN